MVLWLYQGERAEQTNQRAYQEAMVSYPWSLLLGWMATAEDTPADHFGSSLGWERNFSHPTAREVGQKRHPGIGIGRWGIS